MSEPETSGAPLASAETIQPPAAFGTSRGSGLARGKRPAAAPAPSATASTGEYSPTAIEVVTPKSDYQNPFAEPAPAAPVNVISPAAVAPAPVSVEMKETPTITPAPAPVESAVKPQLNILPPAEAKRPSVSWESGQPGAEIPAKPEPRQRREDRPVFRAERPESKPFESHDPRDLRREQKPFEAREPREPRDSRREPRSFEPREQRPFEPREPREQREPRREQPFEQREARPKPVIPTSAKKSGGFFGWLKSLFAGPTPAKTDTNGTPSPDGGPGRDDPNRQHRRRHRGGRGRGGFRDGGAPRGEGQQPRHEGGHEQNGGQRHEGGDRRRRRGGRGRNFRQGDQPRGQGGYDGPPAS